MLGGRAVATKSITFDSLAHAPKEAATLSSTTFPIASFASGGRTARAMDAGSIDQPPPGGEQATRESLKVKGLLPIAACSVSALAERGTASSTSAATIRNKRANEERPGSERTGIPALRLVISWLQLQTGPRRGAFRRHFASNLQRTVASCHELCTGSLLAARFTSTMIAAFVAPACVQANRRSR